MFQVGEFFEAGSGVPKDLPQAQEWYKKALAWYRDAADAGSESACHQLGWMHQHGLGVTTDLAKALEWYQVAMERGCSTSMAQIGYCHEHGWAVPKDLAQALSWYQKADAAGEGGMAVEVERVKKLIET